ncbi:MAG: T9SS type A sorting domain-containing protein [bacterium]
MKNLSIILFLLVLSTTLTLRALTRAPEDFMGRVTIPNAIEVEVLKFKTDQIVYAGTNGDGLYVSYDGGSNWVKLTEFPKEFPCVKDIIFAPNKDMYAATFGGGIYYSKDNGAKWTQKNKGLKNLYVQALTVTNKGKLICGTYGGGVYFSDDNGDNWTRTDKGLRNDNVTCLLAMRNGRILAGTLGGGVYTSRDTCKSWVLSNTELKNYFLNDFSEDESGKIYAATNGGGVMFSGDGMTWNTYPNTYHLYMSKDILPLLDTAVVSVAVNKYQMLMGTRTAGMYFWDDLMNCWQNSGDLTTGITASAVSPNGTILAIRSYGQVIRSTDNGLSWIICSKNIPNVIIHDGFDSPDFIDIYVGQHENSIVSVNNNGTPKQLSISKDHGNIWKYLNSIETETIYDVEITPDSIVFVADEDGVHRYSPTTGTFDLVCSNPDEPKDLWKFLEVEYNAKTKTLFAIYKLREMLIEPPAKPKVKRLIYRLYQSFDNGNTWTYIDYGGREIKALHYVPNGDLYIKIDSLFCISTDNGATFTTIETTGYTHTFGKDGNLYHYDTDHQIFYQKNKTGPWKPIPFTPELYFDGATWRIQSIGSDIFGCFYVSIKILIPDQGMMYELYKTNDYGSHWQTMKGCYNMDRIRDIQADNGGYIYFLSNALYKVLNPKALKPPVIIAPKDGQKGEEINPIMAWKTVPLAEEYELQFDQLDDFPAPFEINVTGDSACKVVLNLFYGSEFYWRICSKTHSARSEWTETHSFTIGLEPPILISPEKGKVGVSLNADLKWHKIEGALHYTIQVAEDENFDKIVFSQENHTDTTITTDKLAGTKTYYWRVKAFTKDNSSRYSEVWNFRTIMGPPPLIYPENKSIDKQLSEQFTWHKSAEAQTYFVQVAKDSAFTDLFFEGNAGADTFKIIDNLLAETEYYWHVASINSFGTSDYSEIWTFSTSLKAVELIYPENQKVNVPIDAKFTWMEHAGGSEFQIQISKESDFKTTVVDTKVKNLLEFQTNKLEYYKNYFWRVRLVVGQRFGLWSEIRPFKTGIQSANLLNPPDKSKDQSTTIKFRWYEVIGSKFYQLQISKNELFTDIVYSMDSLIQTEQYVEELEPEILYYWRVRAWNEESFGTSQWSNIWTFTTGKVTLVLRNPKTGSTGVNIPTLLLWFPATTAEYYNLQVAKDEDFVNVIFDKDSIFDTKWTLTKTDVAVSTDYFWRVKGVSKQYTTPWSDIWHFTTASTSIKENELFSAIKLYPNPTGNNAELSINYTETCDAKIQITTAEGKIIKTDAIRLLHGETRYEINAEHLTSGKYYITISTPSGFITRELVVIK